MAIVYNNREYRNLQEQVLKNAQDIEILKEKPSLKIVIVEELPEVGEEGILYLVPKDPDPDTGDADSYDEYVWLPESETFELVGNTAIDLSNMVTPSTPQTIKAGKTFTSKVYMTNSAEVTGDVKATRIVVGADGYNIKKDGSNMVIEADGNDIKVRGSLVPNSADTYSLGTGSVRWNVANVNNISFGDNAIITKDSSNRINLNNGGNAILKVGGYGNTNRTYIANNLVPDTDGLSLNLGATNMRWSVGFINSIENDYGALQLRARAAANPWVWLDTNNVNEVGGIAPASDQSAKLGNAGRKWLTTYTRYINDDNVNIAVSDIATKPDYANPDVFESGTLDGNGQGTIDMTQTGVPSDGLYMFTYGNCQCFLSLTSTMIQNASTYPIRCTCPMMYSGSAYPGILKIERAADVLTLTVATAGVGNVTPAGYGWQLIKVM